MVTWYEGVRFPLEGRENPALVYQHVIETAQPQLLAQNKLTHTYSIR